MKEKGEEYYDWQANPESQAFPEICFHLNQNILHLAMEIVSQELQTAGGY